MTSTARELFEHELRDIYDAENKLVNALENMANKVEDDKLSQAFSEHKEVTQKQAERLEQVFKLIDRAPRREPCHGINGLIEEFTEFVKEEDPEPAVLNVFATAAALKVEHYEIATYRSLIALVRQQGLEEAVSLFQETLAEEEDTAREVEQMGQLLGEQLSLRS